MSRKLHEHAQRTQASNGALTYDQLRARVALLEEQARRRHVEDISERKQSAHDARESHQRLAAVMQTLPVGVAITDLAGGRVAFNAEFERIWGGPGPETRSVRDYEQYKAWWADTSQPLAPEDWASARALQTGQPVVGQLVEIERFDGSRVFVLNSAAPIRDASGAIIGAAVALQDVSGLRQMEQALRESEERFRAAFEKGAVPMTLAALDGQLLKVNAAFTTMLGYSASELIGRSFSDITHPDDLAMNMAGVERVTRGELDTFRMEKRYLHKNGAVVWGDMSTALLRDARGAPLSIVTHVQDISERKRAEQAFEDRERQLRVVLENVSSGVALIDASGQFTLFNRRLLEMFGLSPDSTILNIRDRDWGAWVVYDAEGKLMHVDDHPIRRAVLTRQPVPGELVGVRLPSGGDLIWMLITAVPLLSDDGSVQQVICTCHDITELKHAQEALREADHRKNEFLAVLSHELRNPLAPIVNSLYILERAPPGGEQANRAKEVIGRQVAHLSNLVDDLLDVTRITRNKIQLHKERLELNEVVRRAVEDSKSLFEQAEVRLELAPAARAIFVTADRTRVAQIVGNLLHNAAKFTLKGGSTRVSVAMVESTGVVRVADTGVGMSGETLARLFQSFVQADQTLDRSKGGLGLGLALVKGLVELHGGSASAHSEGLGKGSEFVVHLPLDFGIALEPVAPPSVTPRARRRILIIDDSIDVASSLRKVLQLNGHEVEIARSGPEGLAKAHAFQPEVVLCDIGMPGMDGFEVARAFRADESLKGAYLVALSGYALPDDLQRAAEAGFQHHIAKPPNLDQLVQLLANQLKDDGSV